MSSLKHLFKSAPLILLGAFFLCTSCKKSEPATNPDSKIEISSSVAPPTVESPTVTEKLAAQAEAAPNQAEEATPEPTGIRFLSYNVKNYLTMTSFLKNGEKRERSKPEKEVNALIDLIVSQKPDILGICEIGTEADLLDLQAKLKAAGLDLPHSEHAGGADVTRHLALLSSMPITGRNSQKTLPYELDGKEMFMSRGILDVTIDLPNGPTHFIGVHLKSKREVPDSDQAMMRLNEAQLTRAHCDAILEKDPKARLIVYGDFNETKGEAPVKTLKGPKKSATLLDDVWAKDSRGEVWTHFWKYQHQYARFDYVLFSRAMKPEMDFKNCHIVDPKDFYDASDHRPIMVILGR